MILDRIVAVKYKRLESKKNNIDINQLKDQANRVDTKYSFYNAMDKKGLSIIGEIKKASPSRGIIKKMFNPIEIAKEYENSVDAVSILTEEDFFLGNIDYLKTISNFLKKPILMKDFIIEPLQIYEAKVMGASCILLIVSILDNSKLKEFLNIARSIGLDVLVETHTKKEIERALYAGANIIGINNRNLFDFTVDLNTTVELRKYIPKDNLVISESGIDRVKDIQILKNSYINGILVGESFMKAENIKIKSQEFKKAYG